MQGTAKKELQQVEKLHIYHSDFKYISKKMAAIGIKTLGELVMYCNIWHIETCEQLYAQIEKDFIKLEDSEK